MKNRIIISLLFLGLGLNLHAQDKQAEHKMKRLEAQKEVKAYVDREIKPVVASQRVKLDAYLSKKEQREIENLRTEKQLLRKESFEFRKEIRANYTGPNSLSEDQKAKSRELQKKKRLLDTRIWAIADAHETEIAKLLDEMDPHMETWQTEMRLLKQKSLPQRSGDRSEWLKSSPRQGLKGGHRGGFRPGGNMGVMNMRGLKSPIGFLLWDSNRGLPYEGNTTETNVFPNPARSTNTLEFSIKEPGPVKVSILDEHGNLIKTLLEETKETGTYSEKFDLSDLEKGLYIYQIKTKEGITTKKLIIEK